MDRAGAASRESLKAGAVGLLARSSSSRCSSVTIVVLVLTIVGIPLLLLLPFVIPRDRSRLVLVGFTAVANRVGRWSRHGPVRLGRRTTRTSMTILGVLIVMLAPSSVVAAERNRRRRPVPDDDGVGILGAVIEYLAWTVGFGAVALALQSAITRRQSDVSRSP